MTHYPISSAATDSRAVNVSLKKDDTQCVSKKPVSLEKQVTQSKTNAMRTKGENWNTGNCLHCKKDFKKNTVWQKYCHENCRIAAYELRTGKRVNLKKAG